MRLPGPAWSAPTIATAQIHSDDQHSTSMTEIDERLDQLAMKGPYSYRILPPDERAWRGRYLFMVAALGASPIFAWANALAPDELGSTQSLVSHVSDMAI